MLERLFTSSTRTEILKLLIFNQDKQYHLRGIARQISHSPIYVSKELANLKALNLVQEEEKGNLRLFQINKDCVILTELRNLFFKTDYIGELIRKELAGKVKKQYAFIYGSFAQGVEKSSSDIDLFVIGDTKEDELIQILQKLESQVEREINYVLWTENVLNERANGHHLLNSIKDNKLIMLVGDEDEFRAKIR
jgi:predicted nucleotidyltransferase